MWDRLEEIEKRSRNQPDGRRPKPDEVKEELSSWLDRWEIFSHRYKDQLAYYEPTMTQEPVLPVVLGDPAHDEQKLPQVFQNAPQSLRDVEATITFDDEV